MRIKHVHIENFRSIRCMDMDFEPLMIFLGQNNSGKTNLIMALQFFFSGTAEKGQKRDFYTYRSNEDRDIICGPIVVEVTFCDLDAQDKVTFHKYVHLSDVLKVRKTGELEGDSPKAEYHGYTMVPKDKPWLNPDNVDQYRNGEALMQVLGEEEFDRYFPATGRVTKAQVEEFQGQYVADHREELEFEEVLEASPFMGAKTVAAEMFGDFHLVPAVREVGEEIKFSTKTSMGKLLRTIIDDMVESDEGFRNIKGQLDDLVGELSENQGLVTLGSDLGSELADWGVEVDIDLPPLEAADIFRRPDLYVNDGLRTHVDLKGHGLQRAVIFALIKVLARRVIEGREVAMEETERRRKSRAASRSVYFAIEEPELYLHPQGQRQMLESLRALAEAPRYQVLLCTHSSFFVDMDLYRSICIIEKPSIEEGTKPLQCCVDLFEGPDKEQKKRRLQMASWFDPNRSELFFARKVALVEGITEKTVLPMLAHRLGVFDHNVYLLDCGGKFNMKLYIEVLNAFGKKYLVVHDVDPVTANPGDRDYESQLNIFNENQRIAELLDPNLGAIETFDPNFDEEACISSSAKDKLGSQMAAFARFETEDAEIPGKIDEFVRKAYA